MVPIKVASKSHINTLLINKSKYFIKGSITSYLSFQFKSYLHHCFKTTIIGLIGSSSFLCENRPPIDHEELIFIPCFKICWTFFITRNGGCFSIGKVEGLSNGIANGPSNGVTRKSLNDIAKELSNNVIAIITMAIDNSMNGYAKVLT